MLARRFRSADQFECRAIILAGIAEHFGFIDPSLNRDLDDIEKSYLATGNDFCVAKENGHIAGTVGLLFHAEHARIVRMSVDRKHRKRGIATALLNSCMTTARARKIGELVAFTEPHWSDAVGFYLASGFEQFGKDEEDIHLRLAL